MAEQPLDFAVVIGLNDYPSFGASGRPLDGAIHDAERVADWLTNADTGGGLPDGNCKLITSTAEPLYPDQGVIDDAYGAVRDAARAAGGGRRLYFYFSGHGQAKSANDVALCLCKWSSTRRFAALSAELYKEMFIRCSPFAELVILLDCCRVRTIDATGKRSDFDCPVPVADSGAKRHMLAFASEFQNAAMEAAVDAESGDEGPVVRGHFTEALLAGLNGGAAEAPGGVTARGLKHYLEVNVPRVAQAHDHVQNAQVMSDFAEDAQPVFGSAPPTANVRIRFSAGRHGEIVLEGPELEEIRRDDAATGPWELNLGKGLHHLVDVAGGTDSYFRFVPAEEVSVVEF
jgi:hypothetical protein